MGLGVSQLRPCAILCALLCSVPAAQAQDVGWEKEEQAWRDQHATELQKPDGWLSLIGLEWLSAGETSLGSAADNKVRLPESAPAHLAVVKLDNGTVSILPPQGGFPAGLYVDGNPAKQQVLRAGLDHDKFNSHVTFGPLNFYAIRRADRFAIRIKDAKSASITRFHGLNWYAPDPKYRVTAKWIPYTPAKSVSLVTLVGTRYDQPVPGYAEFVLQGKTYRLEPVMEDPQSTRLFFIMQDTTSTETTYPACRFLYTALPEHGVDHAGELVLDFNHLENPPCAYTPYATCPLPPAGNRLPIALPVGEQRYHK
jgi:uncharacterized protein